MRLIDADKINTEEIIAKFPMFNGGKINLYARSMIECVCYAIKTMPTAYDVEKVVEELEKYRRLCFLTMANTGDEQLDIVYDYVSSTIEEAIDIVKRGGVDGSND